MRLQDTDQYRHLAAYLRAEHEHLHEVIRNVEKRFGSRGSMQVPEFAPELVDSLTRLRDELDRHFAVEEEGGCIEEAVCRCPSLSREASRLENEHPLLLGGLDAMIVRLRGSSQTWPTIDEAQRDFKQLVVQLHAHEAAEDRLMQRAFGGPFDLDNNGH